MQLLTNHLGYERFGTKQAVIQTAMPLTITTAQIVCDTSQQPLLTLPVQTHGEVGQWHTGLTYLVDFSALQQCGWFRLQVGEQLSARFQIADGLLMKQTFSDVLHYFKSQRCGGKFDQADHQVRLFDSSQTVDAHGGWYDASGDVSKYLSHLSYSNYFNPQQTPLVVWNMLTAFSQLSDQPEVAPFTRVRLLEEALHGADFLCRMQSPQGYFYMTVFDTWSKDTAQREICAYATQNGHKSAQYQAGFRQGGGMAIAALAAAARILGSHGTSLGFDTASRAQYLTAAQQGYWHLVEMNTRYVDDGVENIIDEYCALLAAVELYRATDDRRFLTGARRWAGRLAQRQMSDDQYRYFWSANHDGSRPYFHASDAGLPVLSLLHYLDIEPDHQQQQTVTTVILQALQFELAITAEVTNPFGYPRQYVKAVEGDKHSSFFIPHHNETGYWWQGENARLASLACMAYQAAALPAFRDLKLPLEIYGQRLLNWILGLNPFDMSMLDGHGRNNPDYLPDLGFSNAKGGVCNGITAGFTNERDIAFNPQPQANDMLQNWRWGEQWIPHAGWYLLAVTLQYKERQDV